MTIQPRRSWLPNNPREIWDFRGLLTRFAAKEVTLRYRQTGLGVAWVILQPLLAAGILAFVFGSVAKLPEPIGVPYIVFSLAGMVVWTTFSQITNRASASLVTNSQLVSKVYFPRVLLPLSTILSVLLDVVVSLVLLAILMFANGVEPPLEAGLAPLWLLFTVLFAAGVGMGAGAVMVRYRDVQFVLPVVIQFLLYGSPVAYSLTAVPAGARTIYQLNPLTGLLEGFRWSVLSTPRPSSLLLLYSAVAAIATFLLGLLFFTRMERKFADVI